MAHKLTPEQKAGITAADAACRAHGIPVYYDFVKAAADKLAEQSWKKRKGPMAAYWRAVSTYARHLAHALSKGAA